MSSKGLVLTDSVLYIMECACKLGLLADELRVMCCSNLWKVFLVDALVAPLLEVGSRIPSRYTYFNTIN